MSKSRKLSEKNSSSLRKKGLLHVQVPEYVPGNLAWVKIKGNHWWPAIVFCTRRDDKADCYQVDVFLVGKKQSRSSAFVSSLKPFNGSSCEECKEGGVFHSSDRDWIAAVKSADDALKQKKTARLNLIVDSALKMTESERSKLIAYIADHEDNSDEEEDGKTHGKLKSAGRNKNTPAKKKGDVAWNQKSSQLKVSDNTTVKQATPAPLMSCDDQFKRFKFLQPGNIKDADGKCPADPDYNPRTLHVPHDFMSKQTPVMKQWWILKSQYLDTVLFFKMEKFYKLFHMDAIIGVNELGLQLKKGDHACCECNETLYGRFSEILINKGYKVTRVEETETPDQMLERCRQLESSGKFDKVVSREVCSVVSIGTKKSSLFDGDCCNANHNFLLAISEKIDPSHPEPTYGICFVDVMIGTFHVGQFEDDVHNTRLRTLISLFPPSQVLYEKGMMSVKTRNLIEGCLNPSVMEGLRSGVEFWDCNTTLKELSVADYFVVDGVGLKWPQAFDKMMHKDEKLGLMPRDHFGEGLSALGAVVWYLRRCRMDVELLTLRSFEMYTTTDVTPEPAIEVGRDKSIMALDGVTLANLRVLDNSGTSEGTLLQKLDSCKTPFGKRLFKQWLCGPPRSTDLINDRLNAVEDIKTAADVVSEVSDILSKLPDLERLISRIHAYSLPRKIHPDGRAVFVEEETYEKRKMEEFITCLEGFKSAQLIVEKFEDSVINSDLLKSCVMLKDVGGMFPNLTNQLTYFEALFEHQKSKKKGVIEPTEGINKAYEDALSDIKLCKEELKECLDSLKKLLNNEALTYVETTKNRYQAEVPESLSEKMPEDYEWTSRRKGFKRYQNEKMKKIFGRLVDAEKRRDAAQKDTMRCIFEQFDKQRALWTEALNCLSVLDVLISMAVYSSKSGMFRPQFVQESPHVLLPMTGPNLRQVGQISILAQLGCYVPAENCHLSPVDRIFARLGVPDHIMSGESASFVELSETSCVLRHATENSLVLLDESGEVNTNGKKITEFLTDLTSMLQSDDASNKARIQWYESCIDRMKDKGIIWLNAKFKPILDDLVKNIKASVKPFKDLKIKLTKVLDFFTRNETLASIFVGHNRNTSFRESFIGQLLSLGPDPKFFSDNSIDKNTICEIEREGNELMEQVKHLLHNFFKKLFEFGDDLKRKALVWIADILQTFMYRSEYKTYKLSVDEDNVLTNLLNMLLMFVEPIMKNQSKHVDIQHNYCMATIGSVEERRRRNVHLKGLQKSLLIPMSSGNDSSPASLEEVYKMPSEIFYMTHLAFHLGFSVIQEKFMKLDDYKERYSELSKMGHYFGEEIEVQVQAELPYLLYYQTLLSQNQLLEKSFQFTALTANFLMHVAMSPMDVSSSSINKALHSDNFGKSLAQVPAFLVDNVHSLMTFLKRIKYQYFENQKPLLSLFEFSILFMANPPFVHDPFQKVKLAEIFDCVLLRSKPFCYEDGLEIKNLNARHAIGCIMKLFVSVESERSRSRRSSRSLLSTISSIFDHLCEKELHKNALVELVMDAEDRTDHEDAPLFLKFIFHLWKNSYFTTDTALMRTIRNYPECEKRCEPYIGMVTNAVNYNKATMAILSILGNISRIVYDVLHHPVMALIVASALDYYLYFVVGQNRVDQLVENSVGLGFNSSLILTKINLIFEDFWDNFDFLTAMSKVPRPIIDELGNTRDRINELGDALDQINEPRILIDAIAATIRALYEEERRMKEILRQQRNIIDTRFLDKITGEVMRDPVRLGDTNLVVDRNFIISHLLGFKIFHPFAKLPLKVTMSMIRPEDDLKAEIEEFLDLL